MDNHDCHLQMWVLDVLALKCLLDVYVICQAGSWTDESEPRGFVFVFLVFFFLFLFKGHTSGHSHNNAMSSTYTTAHGNAGSLTH